VASAFLELLTMRAVVKPFARRSDPLASGYDGGMANHSDKFAATTDLCPDDSKAVLCVLIGDALDHAGEHLPIRRVRLRLHDVPCRRKEVEALFERLDAGKVTIEDIEAL
jgi:hypothetical protein